MRTTIAMIAARFHGIPVKTGIQIATAMGAFPKMCHTGMATRTDMRLDARTREPIAGMSPLAIATIVRQAVDTTHGMARGISIAISIEKAFAPATAMDLTTTARDNVVVGASRGHSDVSSAVTGEWRFRPASLL